MSIDELRIEIVELLNHVEGIFAISFLDLQNSENRFSINGEELFHTASMMKVPVMISIFNMIERGNLSLDSKIVLKNEFKSIVDGSIFHLDISRDSGEGLYEKLNEEVSIEELLIDMIIHSGNLSCNTLIELADAKEITANMKSLGAVNINILRGVEDIKAFEKGLSNQATSNDFLAIFESLAHSRAANESSCNNMIDILLNQQINKMIPQKLPQDIKVAHKTGNIDGVEHDGGIIFLPDGSSYILIILSKNLQTNESGQNLGSKISKLIFDYQTDI